MATFTKIAGQWVVRWIASDEQHEAGDIVEVTKRNGKTTTVELLEVKFTHGYGVGIIENNRKSTRERKESKVERLDEWSEKAEERSERHYENAKTIIDIIPFGQPILVGHHSERGHRRALETIDRNMANSIAESKKAERHREKSENISRELRNSIYDDDEDAIERLKEKLVKMEAERDKCKAYNKKARLEGKDKLPLYVVSNLSASIREITKRIDRLTRERQFLGIND